MSDEIVRILCRWSDDGEELYYAGGFRQGAHDPNKDAVIGICKTPKMERPNTSEDWIEFKQGVEDTATSVRWFGKGGL